MKKIILLGLSLCSLLSLSVLAETCPTLDSANYQNGKWVLPETWAYIVRESSIPNITQPINLISVTYNMYTGHKIDSKDKISCYYLFTPTEYYMDNSLALFSKANYENPVSQKYKNWITEETKKNASYCWPKLNVSACPFGKNK
jgi:hypothetical protein